MSKDDGDKAAKEARRREEERQRRIREGMAQINAIFDGTPTSLATSFDPNQKYFLEDGSLFNADSFLEANPNFKLPTPEINPATFGPAFRSGGKGREGPAPRSEGRPRPGTGSSEHPSSGGGYRGPSGPTPQQIAQHLISQGKLFTGENREGGFDDEFFEGRQKAFLDFAMPELDRQFADAREQLLFALTRGGNLQSSVAADRYGDLDRKRGKRETEIADRALDTAQQARSDVEQRRSNLVAQLNATANPQAAAAAAARQADILSAPQTFQPIGELFANITEGLARSGAGPRTGYQGYAPVLFSGSSGAGNYQRVVR